MSELDTDYVLHPGMFNMKSKSNRMKVDGSEVSIRELLASLALADAVSPETRRALKVGSGGAVVIVVPSAGWVGQVDKAIDELSDHHFSVLRIGERKADGEDAATASRRLADGQLVVGISPNANFLPQVIRTLSEHTVMISPPSASLVTSAIRKISVGRVPNGFSKVNTTVLDFDELAALLGSGGDARSIAERITRAVDGKTKTSKSGERFPDMETATEFGDARLFAMDLKADLDDMRAGLIGWQDVDKGCVLYSIPGCGKTLYARTLGEYLGFPVIVASMADFFASGAGYLDSVIKAQRAIFEKARACSPCVLFLDEVDAIPDLDQISHRGKDWWSPVVLDFLQLLDSATADRQGVVVIGATNRISSISPAILRPGRLERTIRMDPPDANGVERIMRHHLDGALAGADISGIATAGALRAMTGAVIMEAVRAARRIARRAGRPMILDDLASRIVVRESRTETDLDRICFHEAGHALIGTLYPCAELQSVSIEQVDEGSGGHTAFYNPIDQIETEDAAVDRVRILLAGRASELVAFGTGSSGAGGTVDSDLAMATKTLAKATLCYGLGSRLSWRCEPDDVLRYLALDIEARREVESELARIFDQVMVDLKSHRSALDTIARELRAKRTLDGSRVKEIVDALTGEERTEAA